MRIDHSRSMMNHLNNAESEEDYRLIALAAQCRQADELRKVSENLSAIWEKLH